MTNPNEPVFPSDVSSYFVPGLTKREYFAAIALQGTLAAYSSGSMLPLPHYVAKLAVDYANALLVALEEGAGDD